MQNETNSLTFSNLIREINDIVRLRWTQYQVPIVMAAVGKALSDDAKAELNKAEIGLKPFIVLNLKEETRHFVIEGVGDCLAPLPETAQASDDDLQEMYLIDKQKRKEGRTLRIRFSSEIWRAFTTPLGNKARWIIIDKDRARVVEGNIESVPDAIQIQDEDLAFDMEGNRLTYREAQQKILNWSAENGIDTTSLRNAPSIESEPITAPRPRRVDDSTLASDLGSFILQLKPEDAKRIVVPLDLMLDLVRKVSHRNER